MVGIPPQRVIPLSGCARDGRQHLIELVENRLERIARIARRRRGGCHAKAPPRDQ